ncbi:MAG: exodeoxyribonuclease VII large subunit [Euryarchaeota archaeon]|nr:exodeoxyribonuclease VII large subunit [Euryarchaeota archaeon]
MTKTIPPGTRTITVTQLNTLAKGVISAATELNEIWVSGEVSNLTKHSSGHYYFTLKDQSSEIRCTFFRGARLRASLEIDENMKVLAFGSMDVYVQKGSYQFNVQDVKADGMGQLFLAYEALKKKLEGEGLFDPARKRALPRYPTRIGVVTSPTGAAVHDILNVTARRFPADILLAPALVQGEGADKSICEGIRVLNEAGVDVIIVGRGGGSLEDLWAFNMETVARAIFSSKAPIVSAVGHETDFTISDYVADLRAPTPSAAAELVLPDRIGETANLASLLSRAKMGLMAPIERMKRRLSMTERPLSLRTMMSGIEQGSARLDELNMRMGHAIDVDIRTAAELLGQFDASLRGLNPRNVLQRGYCLLRSSDGRTLASKDDADVGEEVEVVMRDGALWTVITRKV